MRFFRLLLAAALFWSFAGAAAAGGVFVVDSYHEGYQWSDECRCGLKETLAGGRDTTIFELDTKRLPPEAFHERVLAAWEAMERARPDVVVLMDDNALRLLGQQASDAGLPVIFLGVNQNPRIYFRNNVVPDNVGGVLERPRLARAVKFLGELLSPSPRRILVMMDDAYTSRAIIDVHMGGRPSMRIADIGVDAFLTSSQERWREKVLGLKDEGYDALVLGGYAALKDDGGGSVPLSRTTSWTAENSPVPVFSFWNFSVGPGRAIGGLLISGLEQGRAAGRLVERYLETGRMPCIEQSGAGAFVFSRSGLDRWGIRLPERIRIRATFMD